MSATGGLRIGRNGEPGSETTTPVIASGSRPSGASESDVGAKATRRKRQRKGSEAEWQALKARYGHRCLRCGRREPEVTLTRDHVIPLGLPGASDGIANMQPLCGPCNAQKGRRALDYRGARA